MADVFQKDAAAVGKFAREIVAKRVAIIAVVTILLNLALTYGWITPDLSNEAQGIATGILDAIAGIVAIVTIRPKVTPVADPKNDSGVPLVSADQVHASIERAVQANKSLPSKAEVDKLVANEPQDEA